VDEVDILMMIEQEVDREDLRKQKIQASKMKAKAGKRGR